MTEREVESRLDWFKRTRKYRELTKEEETELDEVLDWKRHHQDVEAFRTPVKGEIGWKTDNIHDMYG